MIIHRILNRTRKEINYFIRKVIGKSAQPTFLIIGAQKCGTSSLQKYIEQHPNLRGARIKEVHFFDLKYDLGLKWYERQFDKNWFKSNTVYGEASPYYLYHPLVPKRVYSHYPKIKLIILLRDPVERAYSHYKMSCHLGNENLSFEEAISTENKRLIKIKEKILNGEIQHNHRYHSYLDRGKYYKQIIRWFNFFPDNQFLFIDNKKLKSQPLVEVNRVFEFLNLHPLKKLRIKYYNQTKLKITMSSDTQKKLKEYFKPFNKKLFSLLNSKYDW